MTVEFPSEKTDKKLPVLDLKMWIGERVSSQGVKYSQVDYEFYEKEMVTPRVLNSESALSDRIKRQTLANEIIRIRKNTCENEREKLKSEQMIKFAWKLYLSGYNNKSRREILLSGLKGFEKLIELDRNGTRSLYRSRQEDFTIRMIKKHGEKRKYNK